MANPLIRPIDSPYGDGTVYAVPPLKPDVAIVHAQRADAAGDTQVWGLLGCQKEAAFAADRVIVVVEELVDEAVIRADPNRTIIPGPDRRRRRRRAVGRAPLVRPGRLRPRQPLLPRVGPDHPRRGGDSRAWLDEWVYGLDGRGRRTSRSSARSGSPRSEATARRRRARSTTGTYR